MPIIPRYADRRGLIEQIVMEAVKEHLNRRQGTDNITRNFLKFLTAVCGLIEVRNLAIMPNCILASYICHSLFYYLFIK